MKLYTVHNLREHLNWVKHNAVPDMLLEHGIAPVQEFKTKNRTYRFYDRSALAKAKELRQARDLSNDKPVLSEVAPESALTPVAQRIEELHLKIDALHAKVDKLAAVWDDAASTNEPGGTD